jgi:hypothetical protein
MNAALIESAAAQDLGKLCGILGQEQCFGGGLL